MYLRSMLVCLIAIAYFNCALGSDINESCTVHSTPRIFTSAQEVRDYADTLIYKAQKGDFEGVLEIAYPYPIFGYSPCVVSDYEYYLFRRADALDDAYNYLVQKNELNGSLCIQYLENIIIEVQYYMQPFENYMSGVQSFDQDMTCNKVWLYLASGRACHNIAAKKGERPNHNDTEVRNHLLGALKAYINASLCASQAVSFFREPDIIKSYNDSKLEMAINIISVYRSLAEVSSSREEAKTCINNAQELCQRLKMAGHQKAYQDASNMIAMREEQLKIRILRDAGGSERLTKLRLLSAVESYDNLKTASNFHKSISEKICIEFQKLDLQTDPNETVKKLLKIENQVKSLIATNASSSSSSTPFPEVPLADIYEKFRTLLGAERLMEHFWKYLRAFLTVGEIDGGIKRVEIINAIEKSQRGNISHKNRHIAAALKNLLGDHEEWLALEAEQKAQDELKKQKKKQAKEKAHQKEIEGLKLLLAENEKQKEKDQLPPIKSAPSKATHSRTIETGLDPASNLNEPTISEKQRKFEKQQRHEEAEKIRAEMRSKKEEERIPPKNSPAAPPLSKRQQRDLILQSSDKSFAELYQNELSSGSLEVDQEIDNNTWRFTRDQFKVYCTAVGCVYKQDGTIHAKASLPKAVHVMRGDQLITIMNDFGGALTLPAWDKDYVPDYLKRQILEARLSLRALKILELQAH